MTTPRGVFVRIRSPLLRPMGDRQDPETPGILRRRRAAILGIAALAAAIVLLTRADLLPSPVLYDGRLYFTQANGEQLTILDAKTGKPILAGERLPNARQFYASPIAAAGRLYFVDRTGTTLVLKAGDTLEVLATNKLNDPIDASPVAVGQTLFLRGEKFLYAIEQK